MPSHLYCKKTICEHEGTVPWNDELRCLDMRIPRPNRIAGCICDLPDEEAKICRAGSCTETTSIETTALQISR